MIEFLVEPLEFLDKFNVNLSDTSYFWLDKNFFSAAFAHNLPYVRLGGAGAHAL